MGCVLSLALTPHVFEQGLVAPHAMGWHGHRLHACGGYRSVNPRMTNLVSSSAMRSS